MSSFAESQAEFATALREPDHRPPKQIVQPGGRAPVRRFNVYRNNVYAGLIGVIEARFPAVQRLVGDEFFKAMARVFVDKAPPTSPVLLEYGHAFPDFIARFAPVADEPYLADIARLEWHLHEARNAADGVALGAEGLAAFEDDAAHLLLRLAPTVSLVVSVYPVFSLWRANVSEMSAGEALLVSGAESVLITRPDLTPEAIRLPAGGAEFIAALLAGEPLGFAAAAATAAAPEFPLHRMLALLIAQKAIASASVQRSLCKECLP